jgi:hypothetical protein
MKVMITSKVKGFGYNGHRYLPGDIVDIPEHHFRSDFMEKVPELVVATVEPEVTVLNDFRNPEVPRITEEATSIEIAEDVKPKRKRVSLS